MTSKEQNACRSEVSVSRSGLQTPTKKQRTGSNGDKEEDEEDADDEDSDAGIPDCVTCQEQSAST